MKTTENKLRSLFGMALALLITSGVANAEPKVLNGIKAVVNGEPITQSMVDQAVSMQVQMWLMQNKGQVTRSQVEKEVAEIEERSLEDLIDRNLILTEFKKMGGAIKDQYVTDAVNQFVQTRFKGDEDKFLEELKKSGMSLSSFRENQRDQIAIQALQGQQVGNQVIPNTPWEKKRKYNEIKNDFASSGKPKVRIMSIPKETPTSSASQQATVLANVRAALSKGTSFSSLAKKYSDDSFASKGGYVGVLGKSGTLAQGLHDLAYSLPPGRRSDPLDFGSHWRILYVEDRVGKTVPSYDELEERVDQMLTAEKRNAKLETWLLKLRRDANVRINP